MNDLAFSCAVAGPALPAAPADPYRAFLESKVKRAPVTGFAVADDAIHPLLKPHQRLIVRWALAGGCRAIFANFGLGKSFMQLEAGRLILAHHPGERVLISMPLGVRREFMRDAATLGIPVRFVRSDAEAEAPGLYLTNHEAVVDGRVTPARFVGILLDEASVLRSYGSKTFHAYMELCRAVRHRFVATATPNPNRLKELIHYAGFLGVMDTGQALTRFFQRNSEKSNDLTLYPHKEREFWLWVASWAVVLQRPSDLGFSDEGYDLPPLTVRWHEVDVPGAHAVDRDGQGLLIAPEAKGLADEARARKASLEVRVAKVAELVAAAGPDHVVVWHDLEAERHAIARAVPEARSVWGSQDLDAREDAIMGFGDGAFRVLSTKPSIAGSGCNFQRHCHRGVFAGVGHKFNDFIQSIHRVQRFGQKHPVEIDIVHTVADRGVRRNLESKWAQHEEMGRTMAEIIRRHGLDSDAMAEVLERSIGVERVEVAGENWRMIHNDCVEEVRRWGENAVDLIVTSIPFSNHYEYTPSYNDFGHTEGNEQFFRQMDHLTPELLRVLRPGRIAAVHVKDRVEFGNVTGTGLPTIDPFHAECIMHYRRHGFDFCGMIHVNTDVVRENNGTYRLGYTEMLKDSTKMGVGCPEYVLLLHKPQSDKSKAYADVRVAKARETYSLARWQIDAHAFWRSSGDRFLTPEEWAELPTGVLGKLFTEMTSRTLYDHEAIVRVGEALEAKGALPKTFMGIAPGSTDPMTWDDVLRIATLNKDQSLGRREKHVCLARGSRVLTRVGYKPIETVMVGDEVLTHMGRWRKVLAARQTGVQPVVTIRAQGVPGLTLTSDHKLWARKVRDMVWAKAHARREALSVVPDWLEAGFSKGSFVNSKLAPVETPQIADLDTWWIVGRWLADGHVGVRGDLHLSCGEHEVEGLMNMLGHRAGATARFSSTARQIRLRDRGGILRDIIGRCGRGAVGKHLPAEAYTLPVEQASALLNGYLSGDGHYRPDRARWTASSVSKDLMFGIAMLAQRAFGAVASIYAGRKGGASTIQGREVATHDDWILSFDMPGAGRRKGLPFLLHDGAWKKVRIVEDAGVAEVWCLRVEEDESFTAEGCVVKNCPLQLDIVDRLITRFSNPGEEVFDPFGGLGTVPVRALHFGRRGVATELNPGYFRDALRYLETEAARQAVPTLFGAFDVLAASAAPPTAPDAADLVTAIRAALGDRPAPAALDAVDRLARFLADRPAAASDAA